MWAGNHCVCVQVSPTLQATPVSGGQGATDHCECVHTYASAYTCKQLPGNQSLIGKYQRTRRVVLGGGAMDLDGQLLTSLLHDINWDPGDTFTIHMHTSIHAHKQVHTHTHTHSIPETQRRRWVNASLCTMDMWRIWWTATRGVSTSTLTKTPSPCLSALRACL